MTKRQNFFSGTKWEAAVGYSRAVRIGAAVYIAGTTAIDDSGKIVGKGNPYLQTLHILRKIEQALKQAGASLADVVRTRMFVTHIERDWQAIGKAHGEVFRDIYPAATMVEVVQLIDPELLIEMEVDALILADMPSNAAGNMWAKATGLQEAPSLSTNVPTPQTDPNLVPKVIVSDAQISPETSETTPSATESQPAGTDGTVATAPAAALTKTTLSSTDIWDRLSADTEANRHRTASKPRSSAHHTHPSTNHPRQPRRSA